jgi:hypothetical protein
MEHHARESEVSAYAAAGQPYTLGEGGQTVVGVRGIGQGAKSAPPTPLQGAFPFSITAGVEKGTKNRWVFCSVFISMSVVCVRFDNGASHVVLFYISLWFINACLVDFRVVIMVIHHWYDVALA